MHERIAQRSPIRRIVIDDEHVETFEIRRQIRFLQERTRELHGEMKLTALARFAVDPDLSTHHADECRRNRESETRAAIATRRRGIGLHERIENVLAPIGGDADAGVDHREMDLTLFAGTALDTRPQDDFAALGELDGVTDQIQDDLTQPIGIADERGRNGRLDIANELQPLLMRPQGQHLERRFERFTDIELHRVELEPPRFYLREVQDVIDDAQQTVGGELHRFHVLALLARQLSVETQLAHPENTVERRADLMTHVGQEFALRLVRGLCRFARPLQRDLRLLVQSHIVRNAEHMRGHAVAAQDRTPRRLHPMPKSARIRATFIAHDLVTTAFQHLSIVALMRFAFRRDRGELRIGLADHLLRLAAVRFGYRAICKREAACPILHEDEIRRQVDHMAQKRALLFDLRGLRLDATTQRDDPEHRNANQEHQ